MSKLLIYEMYTPSWKGGFPEMTKHLIRLAELGVDYVWLTPCYPSGGVDGGYDITDYMAIDPRYGTMEDFDFFVKVANELEMNVMMDLVMNHTSDQHPWFQASVKGIEPYKDYYLWTDEDLGWGTMFDGGPAFEKDVRRDQYYCHLYHKSQPDLNWDNPDVVKEFKKIIDFWIHHGVRGFRVDSAQLLGKELRKTILPRERFGFLAGLRNFYQNEKTVKVLSELLSSCCTFNIGEMTALTKRMFYKTMIHPYCSLSAGFNMAATNAYDKHFGYIKAKPSLARLEAKMAYWSKNPSFYREETGSDAPHFIAMTESHDSPRFTSRAGIAGQESLKLLFRPETRLVCLYQGQELGLLNPELSDNVEDWNDIQSVMRYDKAMAAGENREEVLARLKAESRGNARVTIDLAEYGRQMADANSCWNVAVNLIKSWRGGNLER